MIFISTAGHGYLKVTFNQLNTAIKKGFKCSEYSFFNGNCALLEENVDMPNFIRVMGMDFNIPVKHQNDINRNCYYRTYEFNFYFKGI